MENRLSVRNVDFTVKQRRHNGIRISGQTPVHLLKYSDRKLLKTGSKASCADCHVSLVDFLPLCSPSSRAGSRRRYPFPRWRISARLFATDAASPADVDERLMAARVRLLTGDCIVAEHSWPF